MAYDEELASRLREALDAEPDLTERKMFGGLGFMVGGSMAVAVAGSSGGLMVRVNPEEAEELIAADGVERMVMHGREMAAWLLVAPEVLDSPETVQEWVDRGCAYARSLPR